MASNLLLSKVSPPSGTITLLTNTPDAADYASVTISCVNTGSANINVSIYITSNATPTNDDIIENAVLLEPSGVLERSCVIVDSKENIFVESEGSGAVFRVYGIEKTIQLDPASAASLNNLTNTTIPNLQNLVGTLSDKVSSVFLPPVNVTNGYLNLSQSGYFYTILTSNTTFSLAVPPNPGTFKEFILEVRYDSPSNITWWSGLSWAGGVAPTPSTKGKDIFKFYTRDGAITTYGQVIGLGYP